MQHIPSQSNDHGNLFSSERECPNQRRIERERVQIPESGIQSRGLCICSEDQGGMYISAQMIRPINNLKSHVITQLGRNESWNSSVYQRYHFHIFQIPSIIIISINAIKVIRVNAHGVAEKDHTKLLPNTVGFSQKLVSI